MDDLGKLLGDGATGGLVIVLYLVVKDVLAPIVKSTFKGKKQHDTELQPTDETRLRVLEVNLSAVTAQVVSFDKLLNETGESLDNKIDLVLAELKEMREEQAESARILTERIARAETHIEHLLQTTRRAGHN